MPRILIAYASNTGNTTFAAECIADTLGKANQTVACHNVAYLNPKTLPQHDLAIIGVPTWNSMVNGKPKEGQIHDQMEKFLLTSKLLRKGAPVAVFALGDSRYRYFCGAALLVHKFIKQANAQLISDPLLIDGFPQFQTELLQQWAGQVNRHWHERLVLAN